MRSSGETNSAPRTVSPLCRRFPARDRNRQPLGAAEYSGHVHATSSARDQRHDRSRRHAAHHESNSSGASAGESEREVIGASRGKKSKRAATVFIAETNSERKEGIRNGQ